MSSSTQSVDSDEKLADYFRVTSIEHFLIIGVRRQEIIHHKRSGREIVSHAVSVDAIKLDPPGIVLNVADVYGAPDR